MKKIILVSGIIFSLILIPSISADPTQIPTWVKGVASFWVQGNINDSEFGEAITFLIEQGIIRVEMPNQVVDNSESQGKISQLEAENAKLKNEISQLKEQNFNLLAKLNSQSSQTITTPKSTSVPSNFKLYELLPSQNDLGSDWKILKQVEGSKPTKNFYYENAGQRNYDKNVKTIKTWWMAVFKFSDLELAKEAYDSKFCGIKTRSSGCDITEVRYNYQNCVTEKRSVEYGKYDRIYGWCLVGKYVIYQEVIGYYPQMQDDYLSLMDIARKKVTSVTK